MTKIAQIWNYEGPFSDFTECCRISAEAGYDVISPKVADGKWWHSEYTEGPGYCGSVEDIDYQRQIAAEHGLQYRPWVNPRGANSGQTLAEQAALYQDISFHVDGMLLDVEPYPDFWGAWNPVGFARTFMERCNFQCPVFIQPDPRLEHLDEIRIAEWLEGGCSVICGQHYWTDFQTLPAVELRKAEKLRDLFATPVHPTLPGNMKLVHLTQEVQELISGFQGLCWWRVGSIDMNAFYLVGGLVLAGGEAPAEEQAPEPSDLEWYHQQLWYATHDIYDALKAEIAGECRARQLEAITDLLLPARNALEE